MAAAVEPFTIAVADAEIEDLRERLDRARWPDQITNISIYWFTRTITSSLRMYYESRHYEGRPFPERVEVPTAVANFPGELAAPPRAWVERQFNLVHWSFPERGGHFAALEAPDLLAADISEAFRPLR